MKHICTVLLFTTIVLAAQGQESERPQTQGDLGRAVFAALQNEDFKAFQSLIFTNTDCEILAKEADLTDSMEAVLVKQMYSLIAYTRLNAEANFNEVLTAGKAAGIKWTKAEIQNVGYQTEELNGISSTDITMICRYKDIGFIVKLNNCHKSDTWLMMDKINFAKK